MQVSRYDTKNNKITSDTNGHHSMKILHPISQFTVPVYTILHEVLQSPINKSSIINILAFPMPHLSQRLLHGQTSHVSSSLRQTTHGLRIHPINRVLCNLMICLLWCGFCSVSICKDHYEDRLQKTLNSLQPHPTIMTRLWRAQEFALIDRSITFNDDHSSLNLGD